MGVRTWVLRRAMGRFRITDDIVAEMNMVAEGVKTSRAVVALARRVDVEMPIAEEVVAVVNGDKKAADVIAPLMERERGHELQGIADI